MATMIDRRNMLIGSTAVGLAGIAPGEQASAQSGPRNSITVRVDRDIENLDPAHRTGATEGNIIRTVFQRLVRQKPNSAEMENDAAAEVIQVSPTMIDFRLKPGQMFSDGFGEMTAEDVKYSIERIGLPPAAGAKESAYKGDWVNLERVEVTGPLSGRIVMSRPRANLYSIALGDVSGCIVSKKAVEQRGVEHVVKPVGSGPYLASNVERLRGAMLKRNPAFQGPKPHFEEISVRIINDPRTAELALRSGEIDFAVLPPSVAEPLRSVQGLTVAAQPSIAYLWIGMNLEKAPLTDIRVRQAIRLGLDVDQMLLAGYNGRSPRLNTVLPPQIAGHWSEAPVYRRNVEEARRLLREAGQPNVKLKLLVLNQPVYMNMALVARALLQEIGVTLEVEAREGGTFWTAGKDPGGKELDLFLLRFTGKHDPNFVLQWFVSGQIGSWNWQRWVSPEFDRIFNEAAGELDPAKRAAMVVQAQRLMDQSASFVWLTNEVNFLVHRSWIRPAAVPGWIDWQYDSFGPVA